MLLKNKSLYLFIYLFIIIKLLKLKLIDFFPKNTKHLYETSFSMNFQTLERNVKVSDFNWLY